MIHRSSFKPRTWKSLGLATSLSMVLTAVGVNCVRAQQQLEAAVLPTNVKIVVILNTSIDSGSQEQQEFEAFLRDDVPDVDGTRLRKGSKLIGTVYYENGTQRTSPMDMTFKKIILPDGKQMKFVAIPRVRGGVMRVTRGDAHFSLDDVLCHSWYKVILRDKDSAGKVLLVPVVRLAPKKGREIHLKPGDIFQIEPAAEARTTIDEKWPPSK